MRLIEWLFVLLTACICVSMQQSYGADSPVTDELKPEDFKAAKRYGFIDRIQMKRLHADRKRLVNTDKIKTRIEGLLASDDKLPLAQEADEALEAILYRADAVLRAEGHDKLADEISNEYIANYQNSFTMRLLGFKEIGDHPPANEWLDSVHDRIEGAIGEYWCQFFHFHLIFVLNHGFPVVLAPKQYDLPDYSDHFAGHMISDWRFKHHGVAGGLTWIAVQVTCSGATSGLGMATFVCGPISGLAEFGMDKYLAPPLAERIWQRAQE